jgi:hypothetical protein
MGALPIVPPAAGNEYGQGDFTVADLIAACDRGRAAGGIGIDAALCEWFAVPCDCGPKVTAEAPRWCIPEAESIDAALPKVLAVLRAEPRQSAPATEVVAGVMARLYPCGPVPTP